ncbi:unnamed protein product [Prunus armeniaca]
MELELTFHPFNGNGSLGKPIKQLMINLKGGLHAVVIIRPLSSWANKGLPGSSRKSLGRPIVGHGLGLGLAV